LIGVLLVVLAIMGMTGRLGATGSSKAAGPEVAGASTSVSAPETGGSAQPSTSPSESADASSPATTSANTDLKAPLTVLNGGGSNGLAGRGRDAFVAQGWEVSEVGNYTGSQLSASTIFYPADNADAEQAAKNLQSQFPKITKLEQAPADLNFGGVVVILTGDWDPKSD